MDAGPVLSLTMSAQMKVNLGNYESADAFLSISGVTMETTQEQVEALLDGPGKITYEALRAQLKTRVAEIRRKE